MPASKGPWSQWLRYLSPARPQAGGWSELNPRGRDWEYLYRQRWQHDKVVRSTHGVNCTGGCSWQVYVKDGIITWETQQTDYPSNGPDEPEYEPRGCQRGASFSWYVYSPLRVKHPYIRGALYELWRAALKRHPGDPVAAWAAIVGDPAATRRYKAARGMGGLVRIPWEETLELMAAALVHTLKAHGPDRVAGFPPIPAMSMVSYASGARFLSLLGGVPLSFYDWYADLPPASPQVWGEQTDVCESADWFNSSYLILWGANLPMTRTPDAHFAAEARYRGTKVAVVSPDYAENVKFADEWLPVRPGTDGALAMAMTHVILREFYVEHPEPYFQNYARQFTDLPFLVRLEPHGDGWVPGSLLTAADLGVDHPRAAWQPALFDLNRAGPAVPGGSIGQRWGEEGRWNLKLEDPQTGAPLDPALTLLGRHTDVVSVAFPRFDRGPGVLHRGVPAVSLPGPDGAPRLFATVFDLLLAQTGVPRGLSGEYPADYDDLSPYTPAWQEPITGVSAAQAVRIAREFAQNAAATSGRSRVIMGAGTNHWYHSDVTFRAVINLVLLTGCVGREGGGWTYYVGQEKVRTLAGFSALAFAADWLRPARQQASTPFFYLATDQWRYEEFTPGALRSPLAAPREDLSFADYYALAARRGWLPAYPQYDANPLDLGDDLARQGVSEEELPARMARLLEEGTVHPAAEDPDAPANFPRVLFVWRSNLLGASSKGHEYFLRHLLGTRHAVRAGPGKARGRLVRWREEAPEGKLDLLITADFRLSDTAVYSDLVLPAATWYEKHDLNTTDLHPFMHPLNPAIDPPWEARSDWDIFRELARVFSRLATGQLGVRHDLVAAPLAHDTPGEAAHLPGAASQPVYRLLRRDYPHLYEQFVSLGPLLATPGMGVKGVSWSAKEETELLAAQLGVHPTGELCRDRPDLTEARQVADAILTLSGASNGAVAVKGWRSLERPTGVPLAHLAEGRAEERCTLADLTAQPRRVITTPDWSGIETGGRRYSPYTLNVECLVPWRTLTGRQHCYLDHPWMRDFGEQLPLYRPPLDLTAHEGDLGSGQEGHREVLLRFISPHNKWSIHSTYVDTLPMLTLFRGGPTIWLNHRDAEQIGVADNDWVEVFNRNGVAVARAVVSHRLPRGLSIMYHAQERVINMPGSPLSGTRGGLHNSVTKVYLKPTHLIGGWAQLSYGFNYYGPIGTQKDTLVMVRRLKEVAWLAD